MKLLTFVASCVCLIMHLGGGISSAAMVVISDTIPTGIESVSADDEFVGLLTNVLPTEIDGDAVQFNRIPAGETLAIGDLVGRAINSSGGGRVWEYELSLPANALPGTGFTDIVFSGTAFERDNNNLEGNDQLTWELRLNGSSTPIVTTGPPAGSDWSTFAVNLADPGGNTVTQVNATFNATGFDEGNEWFATRGQLSATYALVTEPHNVTSQHVILSMASLLMIRRRRRRRAIQPG